jgi:hypothetical protein
MKTYIIERDISGSNSINADGLRRLVVEANQSLARFSREAHWIESFLSKEKSFCVVSMSEEAIADFLAHIDLANVEVREVTATIDAVSEGGLRPVWTAMDKWSVN